MRRALAIALIFLSGCAGLALQPEDSGGAKAAKVATRVVLGVTTFGVSEFTIASEAAAQREKRYVDGLYAELRHHRAAALAAETDAEAARHLAIHDRIAMELAAHLQRRQRAAENAAALWLALQASRPPAAAQTAPRLPVSCQSVRVGSVIQTTCQ